MNAAGTSLGTFQRLSHRGVTLLEILVVVSILAVLAALLLPVLAKTREQGRRTVCLSNLRQIGLAHRLYVQDWDERFPHWCIPVARRPDPYGFCVYWTELLQQYRVSAAILHDPSAREPEFTGVRLADYALLTWGPGGRGTQEEPYFRWPGAPLRLTAVVRPAESVQLTDGWTTTGGIFLDGWVSTERRSRSPLRHNGGMNASMVDGHVRWLPEGEFWRVDTNGRGYYWLHYGNADR